MSDEQFRNQKLYLATMHIAKSLLEQGVISKKQYKEINTKFTKLYACNSCTLFTEIDLI